MISVVMGESFAIDTSTQSFVGYDPIFRETDGGDLLLAWVDAGSIEYAWIDQQQGNPIIVSGVITSSAGSLPGFLDVGAFQSALIWTDWRSSGSVNITYLDDVTGTDGSTATIALTGGTFNAEYYGAANGNVNILVPRSGFSDINYYLTQVTLDGGTEVLPAGIDIELPNGSRPEGRVSGWLQFLSDNRWVELFAVADTGALILRLRSLDFDAQAETTDIFTTLDSGISGIFSPRVVELESGALQSFFVAPDLTLHSLQIDPATGNATDAVEVGTLWREPGGGWEGYDFVQHSNGMLSVSWYDNTADLNQVAVLGADGAVLVSQTALTGQPANNVYDHHPNGVVALGSAVMAWWVEVDDTTSQNVLYGQLLYQEGTGAIAGSSFVIDTDVTSSVSVQPWTDDGVLVVQEEPGSFAQGASPTSTLVGTPVSILGLPDPNNAAPEVEAIGLPWHLDDFPFEFDLRAIFSDPDGDSFTLAIEGLPDTLTYNDVTGLITGTPGQLDNTDVGGLLAFSLTITATDEHGAQTVVPRQLVLQQGLVVPPPTLSVTPPSLSENDIPTGLVVNLSHAVGYDISFTWSIEDASSALPGFDFTIPDGNPTLTIPAGNTTALIRITPLSDDLLEGPEVIEFTFDQVGEGEVDTSGSHLVTVLDTSTPPADAETGLLGMMATALGMPSVAAAAEYLAGLYAQGIKYIATVEVGAGVSGAFAGLSSTSGIAIDLADLFGVTPEGDGGYDGNWQGSVTLWTNFDATVKAQLPDRLDPDLTVSVGLVPTTFTPLIEDDRAEVSLGFALTLGIFGQTVSLGQVASTNTGIAPPQFAASANLAFLGAHFQFTDAGTATRLSIDLADAYIAALAPQTLLSQFINPTSGEVSLTIGVINNFAEIDRQDLIEGSLFSAVEHLFTAAQTPVSLSDGMTGSAAADSILGTPAGDHISGEGGDDTLQGRGGDDLLYAAGAEVANTVLLEGGDGEDMMVYGPAHHWTALGGADDDTYVIDLAAAQTAFEDGDGSLPTIIVSDTGGSSDKMIIVTDQEIDPDADISYAMGTNGTLLITVANQTFWGGTQNPLVIEVRYQTGELTKLEHLWFATQNSSGTEFRVYAADTFATIIAELRNAVDRTGRELLGTEGADVLEGGPTNDLLDAQEGDDFILAGDGDDRIWGDGGRDTIEGGAGQDTLTGGDHDDYLDGGSEADQIASGPGRDTVLGGSGNDDLSGGIGFDTVEGGAGDDTILGSDGYDSLTGDEGADSLTGNNGFDTLRGGAGDDTLWGGLGLDSLYGDSGFDLLNGQAGFDLLEGGADDDTLNGNAGADTLRGDGGDDLLQGGINNDLLDGGAGRDTLAAGNGADSLFGGADDDRLEGNAGPDTLDGGTGDDVLRGGIGIDTFVFEPGSGADRIVDFQNNLDVIALDAGLLAESAPVPDNLRGYASFNADGFLVLTFGTDSLTFTGVTNTTAILDDVVFV